MKYIDSEKLIAEIESEIENSSKRINPGKNDEISTHYRGEVTALFTIKSFITSLQQEQPEDLEKELNEWMKYGPHTNYPWCTIPDAIKITAEHFYELGVAARKEDKQ
jgi:hypothetical protein